MPKALLSNAKHDAAMYGFSASGLARCLPERQGAARGQRVKNAGILTLLLSPNFSIYPSLSSLKFLASFFNNCYPVTILIDFWFEINIKNSD